MLLTMLLHACVYTRYAWHGSAYLGAAHGTIGVLYMLLHVHAVMADVTSRADVVATLTAVMAAEGAGGGPGDYPTRLPAAGARAGGEKAPLVHWCHGAVGAVFLFTKVIRRGE